MSLTGTTSKANELAALRTIPRAANWVALPEALSSQGVFGAYPPGSENYSFGAPYMYWHSSAQFPSNHPVRSFVRFGSAVHAFNSSAHLESYTPEVWRIRQPPISSVYASVVSGSALLVAGDNGGGYVYSSSDGVSWSLAADAHATQVELNTLAVFEGKVYAGGTGFTVPSPTDSEVWSDVGGSWAVVRSSSTRCFVCSALFGGYLYVGTIRKGAISSAEIHRTADGVTWTTITLSSGDGVPALAVFGSYLYAGVVGASKNIIWRTADGTTWTLAYTIADFNQAPHSLCASDSYLYCGVSDGTGDRTRVMRSAEGTTWEWCSDWFPKDAYWVHTIYAMLWDSGLLYAGVNDTIKIAREL